MQAARNARPFGVSGMQARILIADDNSAVRKTLRLLLQNVDHWEISEAGDGREAIKVALELRPQIVILDLAMPVLDGLNAAREISKAIPDTPILMYTMHWTPALELAAVKFGVSRVVSKSDSTGLLVAVQELLVANPEVTQTTNAEPPLAPVVSPPANPKAVSPDVIAASESSSPPAATDPPKEASPDARQRPH
jgi:DNA-binding NarL/FixJ family response regulator